MKSGFYTSIQNPQTQKTRTTSITSVYEVDNHDKQEIHESGVAPTQSFYFGDMNTFVQ